MITQKQSKALILAEWQRWAANNPARQGVQHTLTEGFFFFLHIDRNHRDFLDFRTPHKDKWLAVKPWLLRAKLIGGGDL